MAELKFNTHSDVNNFGEYSDQYGVDFVNIPSGDVRKLEDLSVMMAEYIGVSSLDATVPSSVSYHLPHLVLASPLSLEQRSKINNGETPGVASKAVAIQGELAKVPIRENFERFTHIGQGLANHGIAATFSSIPFHEACGEWANKDRLFWARESFTKRLVAMGAGLNEIGYGLHFEDAFRPVGVQEGLFKRRVAWTRRDYPEWGDDQILQEAMSKTAVRPRLASHKAGAAVDARLRSLDDGKIMDFGHDYPDGGAIVYPLTPFVTNEQWFNRQLFHIAGQLSGLTLYVGEDWHLSYKDNLASLNNGQVDAKYVAQYGPIKSFDICSGEIISAYDPDEIDVVFDF